MPEYPKRIFVSRKPLEGEVYGLTMSDRPDSFLCRDIIGVYGLAYRARVGKNGRIYKIKAKSGKGASILK